MGTRESIHKSLGRPDVLNDQKVYLSQAGVKSSDGGFHRPMYWNLTEVLDIIKIVLEEDTQRKIEYFRTLESGAVEEFVIIEKEGGRKILLFRAWPVFYGYNKRLEYKLYVEDRKISRLITYYLGICARTNNANLVLKE